MVESRWWCVWCVLVVGALPVPALAQQSIGVGQTRTGSLARGDSTLRSGEFFDTYTLNGARGQLIIVELESTSFDAYVILRGPGDTNRQNDDARQGVTNSRIDFRLPADGTYRILATSFRAGETGSYTLKVAGTAPPARAAPPRRGGTTTAAAAGPARPAAAPRPAAPPPSRGASGGAGSISVGQTVTGSLASSDPRLTTGRRTHFDTYRLQGRRGQRLTIRLRSSAIDPFLFIRGNGLNQNNDDADGRNSRLTVTLPRDGTYEILASSFNVSDRGSYTLAVEGSGGATSAGPAAAPPAAAPQPRVAVTRTDRTIAPGQTVNGTLSSSAPRLRTGRRTHFDAYTLTGRRGQRLTIRLRSSAIDPFLFIRGNGLNQSNDDADGRNSQLTVTLPRDGSYEILASSFNVNDRGAYTLSVASSGGATTSTTNTRTAAPPAPTAQPTRTADTSGGGGGPTAEAQWRAQVARLRNHPAADARNLGVRIDPQVVGVWSGYDVVFPSDSARNVTNPEFFGVDIASFVFQADGTGRVERGRFRLNGRGAFVNRGPSNAPFRWGVVVNRSPDGIPIPVITIVGLQGGSIVYYYLKSRDGFQMWEFDPSVRGPRAFSVRLFEDRQFQRENPRPVLNRNLEQLRASLVENRRTRSFANQQRLRIQAQNNMAMNNMMMGMMNTMHQTSMNIISNF